MTQDLTAARFQPPAQPSQQWLRSRLLRRLANRPFSVLVVEAAAGYGKSLLTEQWLTQLDQPYYWLNLSEQNLTPAAFIKDLESIFKQLSLAANRAETTEASAEEQLILCLKELDSSLKKTTWLVLDHLENLASPTTLALIQTLLDHRPHHLKLVICSRQPTGLKLTDYQIREQLLNLQAWDLALDPQEFSELAEQLFPQATWLEKARLYQDTLGWPAALRLQSHQLASWLEQEIGQHLTAPNRSTLFKLTDQPGSASATALVELTQLGLITPSGHCHPLLQRYLFEQPLHTAHSLVSPPIWPGLENRSKTAVQHELIQLVQLQASEKEEHLLSLKHLNWLHCLKGQPKAARGYNREAFAWASQQGLLACEPALELDAILIEVCKGHLHLALAKLEKHLPPATLAASSLTALYHLIRARIYWQQGEDQLAETAAVYSLLTSGEEQLETFLQALLLLAEIHATLGRLAASFVLLEEADQLLLRAPLHPEPWQARMTYIKTWLWLQEGKQELALTWMSQLAKQFHDLGPMELHLHLNYLQALLLTHKPAEALNAFEALPEVNHHYPAAAENIHRRVTWSLILAAKRQPAVAREELHQALLLAEPEQIRRPFLDAGPGLQELLAEVAKSLAPGSAVLRFIESMQPQGKQPAPSLHAPLNEKLSSREQEVLLLVAEGLSNSEIGERLFISLHTVKTHLKHLMKKLDVRSRTQAVTRARELRLI